MNIKQKADSFGLSAANEDGVGQRSTAIVPQSNRRPKRRKSKRVPIYAANGRVVCEVVDGVFVKRVHGSKHMLRQPPAWAFDVISLEQAERAGATLVKVIDTESGTTYSAPFSRIWERGRDFNRGFGAQRFLMLGDWDTEGGGNNPPTGGRPRKSPATTKPSHVQMSLFGNVP